MSNYCIIHKPFCLVCPSALVKDDKRMLSSVGTIFLLFVRDPQRQVIKKFYPPLVIFSSRESLFFYIKQCSCQNKRGKNTERAERSQAILCNDGLGPLCKHRRLMPSYEGCAESL